MVLCSLFLFWLNSGLFSDNLIGGVDLTGVVIDDDAEDELASMLDRARKFRQIEVKKEPADMDAAAKVYMDFCF